MKSKSSLIGIILSILVVFNGYAQQERLLDLKGPYLGQKPPGMTPEVFAPKLVSTKEYVEFGCSFSPDGKEFYFSRTVGDSGKIYVMKQEDNKWCGPFDTKFSKARYYSEPHVSHDGNKIFFSEFNPGKDTVQRFNVTISVVERETEGWSDSRQLWNGMYATTTLNGDIYYTNAEGSIQKRSYKNSKYGEPESLQGDISNFPTGHPFIAPDESYIIFGGFSPDGQAKGKWADLYISIKNKDGSFGKPINLGDEINNQYPNICPMISPDGKYFFYSNKGDIYWVDAKIIEGLKPEELK